MATKLAPIIYRDWRYGMNDSVANALLPDQYLRLALNVSTDEADGNKLGNVRGRNGYAIIGSQITSGKNILGLGLWSNSAGTSTQLVATVNDAGDTKSQTYYLDGSTWTEIGTTPTSFTAGSTMRFATFLDLLWAANADDSILTWDGTASSNWGTTQATSAPQGNLITPFYSRMNISGNSTNPSRVNYSSFPDASNNITWSGSYLDVNPNDGDKITALERNSGLLLVFKNRYLYTWNGVQTQADPIIDIGTPTQESVQTVRGITHFFGTTYDSAAIYQYRGEYPIEISRPVRGWLDSMSASNYSSVATWKDEDHFYCYLGDITYIDGIAYSNVVLRYSISKDTWAVYTLADGITASTVRIETSGTQTVVLGDDDGSVHTWNSGNTDNGSNIEYRLRTKEYEFGSRHRIKTINRFAVYSEQPQMVSVRCRVDGKKWYDLGQLNQPVEVFETNLQGFWFEFEFSVANEGIEPFTYDGIEFIDIKIEEYAE